MTFPQQGGLLEVCIKHDLLRDKPTHKTPDCRHSRYGLAFLDACASRGACAPTSTGPLRQSLEEPRAAWRAARNPRLRGFLATSPTHRPAYPAYAEKSPAFASLKSQKLISRCTEAAQRRGLTKRTFRTWRKPRPDGKSDIRLGNWSRSE